MPEVQFSIKGLEQLAKNRKEARQVVREEYHTDGAPQRQGQARGEEGEGGRARGRKAT